VSQSAKLAIRRGQPEPPPDRGRLLDAEEIAREIFYGKVSARWVRRHVTAGKVKLGHVTVMWWEIPVRDWLATRTVEAG
jgi:hypothetical protein